MRVSQIAGFVVDYPPELLEFKNYQLPNFILKDGKEFIEAEELLAWILDYSRKKKEWLAIEQRAINDDVQKAYFEYNEKLKKTADNKKRVKIFKRIKFLYYLKSILSLGIYSRHHSAPVLKLHTIPLQDVGYVKLFDKDLGNFHQAFKEAYGYLRENGFLHARTENYILYLYPSKEVFDRLLH